ncbi:MAG TPA: type II methionyl aminopeptidase [Nitrososphaeraceae archaeon]|nr:type II methionyl aminopeptidase [Nitrososphaeraceae archaeon]
MDLIECYRKAGQIACSVRDIAKKKGYVGKTLYEICEKIEKEIRENGGNPAFPVNVSLNEIAAHYTAEPNDRQIVSDQDVLKLDIGVHVDGYIADTAVTISYNNEFHSLVKASENALLEALKVARSKAKSNEIGKAIENSIIKSGYMPIKNLSGHSLERYTIHAGKSIPNINSFGSFLLESDKAYAIEPFVTLKNGIGIVHEGNVANIFAIISRKPTKNKELDNFLNDIWGRYKSLPFALRWLLDKYDEKNARNFLDILKKKKNIHAYPILVEGKKMMVSQSEHTIIPHETFTEVITSCNHS